MSGSVGIDLCYGAEQVGVIVNNSRRVDTMALTLPTRMPDGTTRVLEYHPLEEVLEVLPVHVTTARRKLATGRWPGARFGGRWYMTDEDMADAVADMRGEGTDRVPHRQPGGPVGTVVDDATMDDVGGVR